MCRHHFHDIIIRSFPDIVEIRFFNNDSPHLHTQLIDYQVLGRRSGGVLKLTPSSVYT